MAGGAGPEATWAGVADELVAGIHHTLNNRAGAIAAVVQVLESELGPGDPLRGALRDEVERLHATVGALSQLPRTEPGSREPVLLPDVLAGVVELYGYHHAVRDTPCTVEGAPDVLPVWVERTLLTRVLLVMAIAAGRAARAAGTGVRVECSGDAEEVRVAVEAPGEPVDGVEALGGWAGEMGGSLQREDAPGGATRLVLTLPTLPEVRRRERAGLL